MTETDEAMQIELRLELQDELTKDSIVEIAEVMAKATDSATDNITIQDMDGKILYIRSEPLPENDI